MCAPEGRYKNVLIGFFCCCLWDPCSSNQGSSGGPWWRNHRVLTTGPPGKSHRDIFFFLITEKHKYLSTGEWVNTILYSLDGLLESIKLLLHVSTEMN